MIKKNEKDIIEYDENGKRHGYWKIIHNAGTWDEGKYIHGKKHGEWLCYYNGYKKYITKFSFGKINGVRYKFDKNGGIIDKTRFFHGKIVWEKI